MKKSLFIFTLLIMVFCTLSAAAVTIEVWYHEYGEAGTHEAVLRYAEMFEEEHPDIEVKINWIPGDYNSKLNTALLSKQGTPDVFESDNVDPDMVKQGLVVPLDKFFTEEIRNDLPKQYFEKATFDGSVYAIQTIIDTGTIYINTKLLEEEGLSVPQTFDELIDVAQKLTKGNRKGLFIGNDGGGLFAENMVYAAGVPGLVTADDKQVTLALPEYRDKTIKALTLLRELNKSGVLLKGAPADWYDASAFKYGLTAMQWGGFWSFPEIKEQFGDDFTTIPIPPIGEEGEPATFFGGWMTAVNGNSKNIEAAKEFVNWMWIQRNEAIQVDWSTGYGFHIPAHQYIMEKSPKLNDERAKNVIEATFNYGELGYRDTGVTSQMRSQFNDLVSKVITTDRPIDELVDETAALMQKEIDQRNQ